MSGGDHSAADHFSQVHARVHHGGVELLGALRGERAVMVTPAARISCRRCVMSSGLTIRHRSAGYARWSIGRQSGDFVQGRIS